MKQSASIEAEEFDENPEASFDLAIHLIRGEVDEMGREVR
jgi:hypothetical protein